MRNTKNETNLINAKTLVAVHTHTHTQVVLII